MRGYYLSSQISIRLVLHPSVTLSLHFCQYCMAFMLETKISVFLLMSSLKGVITGLDVLNQHMKATVTYEKLLSKLCQLPKVIMLCVKDMFLDPSLHILRIVLKILLLWIVLFFEQTLLRIHEENQSPLIGTQSTIRVQHVMGTDYNSLWQSALDLGKK